VKLLVAEKPSVARDHYQKMLQRVAGESFVPRDGYLEGKEWCITWAVGHLVTLAPMDAYEGMEGSWKLDPLPLLPDKFQLMPIEQTRKQLGTVVHLMQSAETIINGADAGREGNLIFDLIIDLNPALRQKVIERLWVNSYVEEDLDAAFARIEPASHRIHLSYAARLRQRADWLVGLNATRAYTLTAGRGKLWSVGRVQTPTLALVVQRDLDVESFKEFYVYGLEAQWEASPLQGLNWLWLEKAELSQTSEETTGNEIVDNKGSAKNTAKGTAKTNKASKSKDKSQELKVAWTEIQAEAERTRKKCLGQMAVLETWKVQTKRSLPPKPFDLTDLQKEAHRKLKLTAARTLEIAQELYERKWITYPRTDSAYLTESQRQEAYQLALDLAPKAWKSLMRPVGENFSFINDKKVSDHFAILPTKSVPPGYDAFVLAPQNAVPSGGISLEHLKLYHLIRLRFLTAWLEAQEWKEGVAILGIEEEKFKAVLRQEVQKGWKSLKDKIENESGSDTSALEVSPEMGPDKSPDLDPIESEDNSSWVEALPDFKTGMTGTLAPIEIKEKKKARPKYYTEASLLQAMKTAGRQIEDEELAEAMKERGLGTPATQANILETLKSRAYISEEKGYLVSTSLGRRLIAQVDSRLKSPELTGEWEFKLRQVEKGQLEAKLFMDGIRNLLSEVFEGLRQSFTADFEREKDSFADLRCRCCQKELELQNWGLRCSDSSCAWTFSFAIAGRPLSSTEVRQLFAGKELTDLEGFKSKRGFDFRGGLRLGPEPKFEIELVLDEDPERVFVPLKEKCPACKSELSHNGRMIRCDNERCHFQLWKTIAKRKLQAEEWAALLKNKKTPLLEGFVSKKGSTFSASLMLNPQFQVEFVFDQSPRHAIPENSGSEVQAQDKQPPLKEIPELLCPKCKNTLYLGKDALGCIGPQCHWQAPRLWAGHALRFTEWKALLENGRSPELRHLKGREKMFRGELILGDAPDFRVHFDLSSCVSEEAPDQGT
jgi:DNA topoisomerase-3